MTTDTKTLNNYFAERKRFEDTIFKIEMVLSFTNETMCSHDQNISSVAAEYILEILTDPSNQEKQYMVGGEIEERLIAKEPRFTESNILKGLDLLLFASQKIERISHNPEDLIGFRRTIYQLKK